MRSLQRHVLGLALVLATAGSALLGCQPKVVHYTVRVVTAACTAPSPVEGATYFRFKITGDEMEPLISVAPRSSAVMEIPEIPAGKNRMLEVRAYNGDPDAGGKVISLGSSLPFEVPDVVPEDSAPVEIAVFLRRVNTFTPPSTVVAPTTCSTLLEGRAAHTATLLQDGRVYIAGGYELSEDGSTRQILDSAEIFNPGTGSFEKAPRMGNTNLQDLFSPLPRAFHSATLLNNGQVFITGGMAQSSNSYFAVRSSLVYDTTVSRYGALDMISARISPGIATDIGGRVLVVGGTDTSGKPVQKPEWYDPSKAWYVPVDRSDPDQLARENPRQIDFDAPRVGMSVSPVQGGKYITVAGGSDGTKLTDEVLFFSFDGSNFTAAQSTARLRQTRFAAGIAPFQDENKLMVVGGYNSATEPSSSLNSSEIIATDSFNVSDGQVIAEARGDVCVAPLPDGRVLIIGGRSSDSGSSLSSPKVELMTPSPSGGAPVPLSMPDLQFSRYQHTCTTLKDGSVLVLGGLEERAGARKVLQDAWIFTPAPLD